MDKTPNSKLNIIYQDEQPKIPQIFLSRKKPTINDRNNFLSQSGQIYQAKQVVIDARKVNLTPAISRQKSRRSLKCSEGIRGEIDICLNAIRSVYEQKRKKNSLIDKSQLISQDINENKIFMNSSIHRVDSHILLEYIHTIEQQYEINNHFPSNDEAIQAVQRKIQQSSTKNSQSRYNSHIKATESRYNSHIKNQEEKYISHMKPTLSRSIIKQSQSNQGSNNKKARDSSKKFISLTLSQGRPNKSVSKTKDRQQISQSIKKDQNNQKKYPQTAKFEVLNNSRLNQNSISVIKQTQYIQKIDFPERQQYFRLQKLYKDDRQSLKEFVLNNIAKMKGQLLINITSFERNQQRKQKSQLKLLQFYDQLHMFLKTLQHVESQKPHPQKTLDHYNQLLNLHKKISSSQQLLRQAYKLNWFTSIYGHLCQKDQNDKKQS